MKLKQMKYVIMSMLTVFACFFNQLSLYQENFTKRDPFTIDLFIVGLFAVLLFYFYRKQDTHKLHWLQKILILFISLFMVLGSSFHEINSWDMLFATPLLWVVTIFRFIGYTFLFHTLFQVLDDWLDKKVKIKKTNNGFLNYFDEHPIKVSIVVLLACWVLYLIAFYPIILSPDPSYQILQFFNIPTKYTTYAIPLSPDVNLTNHHPVIHTMLLGGFLKFGRLFSSDNFGLFCYSLFQTAVLMSALITTIVILKKERVPVQIRFILLLLYALVPMFPFYAMSGVKDTIYTSLIIFYGLFLYGFAKNKSFSWKYYALFFLNLLLLALFRSNGIYVIVLSLPWLILFKKQYRKVLLVLFVSFLGLYLSYDKVLLPSLKITSGSEREMLSIPFQQTARLAKEYPGSFTKEEKKVVDHILGFDTLGKRYQPEISDPVKNEYNPHTTKEELMEYFKVWFQGFLKHPEVYVEATLNNIYGYFYPGHTRWYIYSNYYSLINDEGVVDYHYNSLQPLRDDLAAWGNAFPYIPGIGLLSNIGFHGWLLLLLSVYSIIKKKSEYLYVLLPFLVSLLICIASPVNSYFRYAMPYVFFMPFLVSIFVSELKLKKDK